MCRHDLVKLHLFWLFSQNEIFRLSTANHRLLSNKIPIPPACLIKHLKIFLEAFWVSVKNNVATKMCHDVFVIMVIWQRKYDQACLIYDLAGTSTVKKVSNTEIILFIRVWPCICSPVQFHQLSWILFNNDSTFIILLLKINIEKRSKCLQK